MEHPSQIPPCALPFYLSDFCFLGSVTNNLLCHAAFFSTVKNFPVSSLLSCNPFPLLLLLLHLSGQCLSRDLFTSIMVLQCLLLPSAGQVWSGQWTLLDHTLWGALLLAFGSMRDTRVPHWVKKKFSKLAEEDWIVRLVRGRSPQQLHQHSSIHNHCPPSWARLIQSIYAISSIISN